ncbi:MULTISPECIES: dihydroorotate dehydrogenase electron transfer subunit [Paenibacillus]|uniref:Dihydroorotate dehydrogenase electron transfer subunit n=1 Tax=Paenibacillus radicis (ex Xue et al. 2023) TaxID=2972489 RepID=A0ABT1YRX8_9BACL|nr:dihydroorotate dehydrogenase electron transfer subunit [Paenibacillus radicis (ex Xue et al. 2023)]MCR8635129.1 dihydroorotate dehydrogenase electron transfer subunit [Paenibacillus radicis (ex Xue et al. 2023)]
MRAEKRKVLSNQQVSERYWHMIVDASNLHISARPGQFFNVLCGEDNYPLLRRPFSIYRINKDSNTLEFLYLVKGIGTQRLAGIKAGETVDIFGPLGTGFTLRENEGTILMLARGVGIATLAALAQEAAEQGIRSVAILSARTRNDLLAAEALQGFGAKVYKVTDEDGTSGVGHVRQLIEQIMSEDDISAAYTCGSKRLSMLLQEVAAEKDIFAEIALEENMGCAMGVCFACVCDIQEADGSTRTVRVCKEGPVFSLEQVVLA